MKLKLTFSTPDGRARPRFVKLPQEQTGAAEQDFALSVFSRPYAAGLSGFGGRATLFGNAFCCSSQSVHIWSRSAC
jgi:hypothetical protein